MTGKRNNFFSFILLGLSLVSMLVSLYGVFIFAPTEKSMGNVQRIFYFHVATAWVGFFAFGVVFVASILFLWKKARKWDRLALCSAEVGVVFTTLIFITGPLWAKPVWNTWWTWDLRLTTSLILWLIDVAYLMLRQFAGDEERGARFAAVFGIIGFVDVPIVYLSIRLWRTLHPAPVIFGREESGLEPEMLLTLILSLMAFTFLYLYLLRERVQLEKIKDELKNLKREWAIK
ncbi:MAG: cytochrome c biogenesis protein [candidate division KSB1 bacterium]|nr:cytochrome c biogenesis protein [candidate division KSB1 bacterium]